MSHGAAHMPFFQYLNDVGLFVVGLILSFAVGRIFHELTHVLVANLLGHRVERIRLNPLNGRVEYNVDHGTPLWHVRAIGLSPFVIGIATAGVFAYMFWGNWPSLLALYVLGIGWFAYTFLGAASDWSIHAAFDDGSLWNPTQGERLLVVALGLLMMAFIGQSIDILGDYAISAGLGLAFAAFGVMGLGLYEIQSEQT